MQSHWGHWDGLPICVCHLYVGLTFICLILSGHSLIILKPIGIVVTFATLPAVTPKCIVFVSFVLWVSVWSLGSTEYFYIDAEFVISLSSAIVWSSLYTSPSYFFHFNRLWSANLNASANIFMVFAPATHLLMSLLCRLLINKNIITLLVMFAGSIPLAFSIKLVKFWLWSCNVSSGLHLQCGSLAACTWVSIGEFTSSSFLFISCQSKPLPNLFNFCWGY